MLMIIGAPLCVFLPLFLLDIFHLNISDFLCRLGFSHYFNGELWFAAVATGTAAILGMLFGLLALIQTRKNYNLENRYHRPSLRLNEACIAVDRISDTTYKVNRNTERWQLFQDYIEYIKKNSLNAMLCIFSFSFKIMNNIEIQDIVIKKISFRIGSKKFCFVVGDCPEIAKELRRRCFKRSFENGEYIYSMSLDLYPYTILKNESNGDEKEFWDDIEYFLNYPNWQDENFYSLAIMVEAEADYEYASRKSKKLYGYILWNNPPVEPRIGTYKEEKSCNGYFSYESEKMRL